jgi:phosphate transport system protein
MQRHFDTEIVEIRQRLLDMGARAESMVGLAIKSLLQRDAKPFEEIMRLETEVNELQMEIDERAVQLTALQQPVGSDVRFLFMAARITSELERIADQAVNISQSAEKLISQPPLKPLVDIPVMGDVARKMVRESLEAIVRKDVAIAETVLKDEDQVDAFRDQIFRELLTFMMADPSTISRALSLILISRNLERVGDHATNIAEEVIYWIQGRDVRHRHGESGTKPFPA